MAELKYRWHLLRSTWTGTGTGLELSIGARVYLHLQLVSDSVEQHAMGIDEVNCKLVSMYTTYHSVALYLLQGG